VCSPSALLGFTGHSLPFPCTFCKFELLFSASPFLALCLLDPDVEPNALRHDWSDVYGHIWLVVMDRAGGCTSSEKAAVAGDPESPMVTTPMGPGGCKMVSDLSSDCREHESWFCYTQCRLVKPPKRLTHFHVRDYYQ